MRQRNPFTRTRTTLIALTALVALTGCLPSPAEMIYDPGTPSVARPATVADQVNALAPGHNYADLDSGAVPVYRLVAAERGWSPETIATWEPFLRKVMMRESGGCWNVRNGVRLVGDGAGCAIARQGKRTDSGYGQVLMQVHASWLCPQEGLCTPADVVASPYASMTAFLALVERGGRQPWCYTAKLRRGEACRTAPTGKPI